MKISPEQFQAAKRIRKDFAAGTDSRLIGDAILAQYRPKRQADVIRDRDMAESYQFYVSDGTPVMRVYELLGLQFCMSCHQARRIISRLRKENRIVPHIRIPSNLPPDPWDIADKLLGRQCIPSSHPNIRQSAHLRKN